MKIVNNGNETYGEILKRLGNPKKIRHGSGTVFRIDYNKRGLIPDENWGYQKGINPDFETIPVVWDDSENTLESIDD